MNGIKKMGRPLLAVLAAIVVLLLLRSNVYYLTLFILCGIYVIAVSGLDILFGYSGQISLGHATFYAAGAYTSAILTTKFGVSVWLAMLAGLLVTAVLAVIIAVPASKLVHQFLALLTISAGNMMYVFLSKAKNVTGAMSGIRKIPHIQVFGYVVKDKFLYSIFVLVMIIIMLFIKYRVVSSSTGLAFMAIRENVVAANGMGINVQKYKVMAFLLSALYTSVAGAMYAHFVGFISPETFNSTQSVLFMTMLLFGGMGNMSGPIIGAIVITLVNESLQSFNTYKTLIYGAVLLVAVLFMPRGCAGLGADISKKLKERISGGKAVNGDA